MNATSNNAVAPITYRSSDNAVAEISSNLLTGKKAGTVTITARQEANSDFLAGECQVSIEIKKKTATATVNPASKIYGNANPQFTCQYSGFINGDTETVITQQPTYTCNATLASEAGNYTISAAGTTSDNYAFNHIDGNLAVEKRDLRVIPNNLTRTYGYANPTLSLRYDGFVNNDNENALSSKPTASTLATVLSDAGEHDITCSGGSAKNYNLVYETGKLQVNKASLTIKPQNTTRNEGQPNPGFSFSYAGFRNNDTPSLLDELPVATCTADESSPAGYYDIILTGGSDNNYAYLLEKGILTVVAGSGIEDITTADMAVYPNPAQHYVTIQSNSAVEKVEFYNRLGRLVMMENNPAETINVSHLDEGIYFVRIYSFNQEITQKLIIKR